MSLLKDRIELGIEEAELETQKTLNEFPRFWRWVIIAMAIAVIPGYFISKSLSEKIWLERYQQTAVLAKPSFQNPKSLTVSDASVTTLGTGVYAAAAKIKNENLDLSLDHVPFTVNFYNAQKQLVYSYSDTFYLLPNQTKYLTVPKFTSTEPVAYTNVQLPDNLPWQKRLSIPKIPLLTSQPVSSQQFSPPAFVVEGDFVNNSPYNLKKVRLTFLISDPRGTIIGVSQRDEDTVNSNERRSYKQLWPNVLGGASNRVEVFADTDALDANNLSVPEYIPSKASDLSR